MTDRPGAEVVWTAEGPRSARYDDIYYAADGLAEAREVFLRGCGLPDAWAGRRRFTVAELGFGTGLNILALLQLWRETRPAGAQLHVFSIEAHPLSRPEAEQALSAFPETADLARALLEVWPGRARGFERIDLPELGAVLDVATAEAAEALDAWSGVADAWFLDGFAPSRNPAMWQPEVLDLVAARSAPGARLATFTVAGAVRRGLAERGFAVARAPGHGRKKERLEARLGGADPAVGPAVTAAIVGGGIAGASLALAFERAGVATTLFDPDPGAGASGNPAALVSPRLDVGGGPAAQLYAQAFARAGALYRSEALGSIISEGALRLASGVKDAARFAALAESNLFPPGTLALADPAEESGEPALSMPGALTLAPAAVLEAWRPRRQVRHEVVGMERAGGRWRLLDRSGATLAEADIVCLAGGHRLGELAGAALVSPVRGQATWSAPLSRSVVAASWGGYAVPTREGGVLFGATHQRGRADSAPDPADDLRNLETLAQRRPALAEAARSAGVSGRASVRAATRDRLPLAGAIGPGLFALGGLGGRGFTTAPLLAEHVAATALGVPSPLPRPLAAVVDPLRPSVVS